MAVCPRQGLGSCWNFPRCEGIQAFASLDREIANRPAVQRGLEVEYKEIDDKGKAPLRLFINANMVY